MAYMLGMMTLQCYHLNDCRALLASWEAFRLEMNKQSLVWLLSLLKPTPYKMPCMSSSELTTRTIMDRGY